MHVPISLLEPGDWPALGRFDNEFVTLVNPCAVKGIYDFPGAGRCVPRDGVSPAVPTWGTNRRTARRCGARPNVTLLDPVDDIDLLLARTRVLLVPSLWAEARSRIVLEAMLRGVPVMASRRGRHSGGQDGRAVPAAGQPDREVPAAAGRADGAGGRSAAAGHRPVARGAGAAARGPRALRGDLAAIARARRWRMPRT